MASKCTYAELEQRLNRSHMVASRGAHERRGPVAVPSHVWVGAAVHQLRDDRVVAMRCREGQRGVAVAVGKFDVCAMVEHEPHHPEVAVAGRHGESGPAKPIDLVGVGTVLQQQRRHLDGVCECSTLSTHA